MTNTIRYFAIGKDKISFVLRKVEVSVEGAKSKSVSYQCPRCDYFEFESESSKKIVKELREIPL